MTTYCDSEAKHCNGETSYCDKTSTRCDFETTYCDKMTTYYDFETKHSNGETSYCDFVTKRFDSVASYCDFVTSYCNKMTTRFDFVTKRFDKTAKTAVFDLSGWIMSHFIPATIKNGQNLSDFRPVSHLPSPICSYESRELQPSPVFLPRNGTTFLEAVFDAAQRCRSQADPRICYATSFKQKLAGTGKYFHVHG
jgi:hypothetical protein